MILKDDINTAIAVIRERIDCVRMTEPSATNEIDMLEFAIISLEGWRDWGSIDGKACAKIFFNVITTQRRRVLL